MANTYSNTDWSADSLTKATATSSTVDNVTLGGTLTVTGVISPTTHIDMPDSANIKLGTGDDLQLYHDGSNSYITNSTGALKLATESSGIAITIGHTTSEVTIGDNLTVTGTLTLGSGAELTEAELEMLDGITAGTAAASKAVVLDGSKNIATIGTISCGVITQSSATLADTYSPIAGGSGIVTTGALDTGSITSGFSSIDVGAGTISTTGTVSSGATIIKAANDVAATLLLQADNSDDAGDDWKLIANANQTFTIGNDINSAGTDVAHITITPHATVASSTVAVAGDLTTGGDLTVSGLYKGYMPWISRVSFGDDGADSVFVPFTYISEETVPDTNTVQHRLCMPYAGYLEKIVFRCQATADTIDFEIYKAVAGTDSDDADQNKLSSTVSVEDDTANTLVTATFGTNYSFAAGDVLGVKMTYESAPGNIDMQVIWRVLVD